MSLPVPDYSDARIVEAFLKKRGMDYDKSYPDERSGTGNQR